MLLLLLQDASPASSTTINTVYSKGIPLNDQDKEDGGKEEEGGGVSTSSTSGAAVCCCWWKASLFHHDNKEKTKMCLCVCMYGREMREDVIMHMVAVVCVICVFM